jgi:hypothetical protein
MKLMKDGERKKHEKKTDIETEGGRESLMKKRENAKKDTSRDGDLILSEIDIKK